MYKRPFHLNLNNNCIIVFLHDQWFLLKGMLVFRNSYNDFKYVHI